ncbi:DUF6387 family protein [Pseudoalteromonas sp. BZP1]|uniref:DUF6387 family protein n=1 Tax=unclassified Pseudoalteromonas TaxID=194690 RepID=UPI0032C48B4F
MGKKYINNTNDRDIAWFNIDNYKYIEELSEQDVIIEFDIRKRIFQGDLSGVASGWSINLKTAMGIEDTGLLRIFINRVLDGKPSIRAYTKEVDYMRELAKEYMLDKYQYDLISPAHDLINDDIRFNVREHKIWLASVGCIIGSYEFLENKNLLIDTCEFNDEIKDIKSRKFESEVDKIKELAKASFKKAESLSKAVKSSKAPFSSHLRSGHALCKVDLASFSDAELVAHFQKSLVEWRELLGVPEPERKVSTPRVIGKLIEFRIIPLLDLFIWEIENDAKIKKSTLSILLFPEGGSGETLLESGKGKIIRFLDKVMASNFDFKDE